MEEVQIKPKTVSELTEYIKQKFDEDEYFQSVLVEGEISNYKRHVSGHLYFTLKDEKAVIKSVMFKFDTSNLKFEPKDGEKVIVFGKISVYPQSGAYQIYVKDMKQAGMGDLYQQYEELKKKLEAEGLFSPTHKKEIPFMPQVIGVLTSNTGSVIKDIINVGTRRNPGIHIRLLPVPVQGEGAGAKIAKAIEYMNKHKLADVLIVGRGGGSLEDLWPFNEEVLARSIFNSQIPIISAVGHDTDYTIADFVADLRAPTPSAAAELAIPNIIDVKNTIDVYNNRLKQSLLKKLENLQLQYQSSVNKLKSPQSNINELRLKIDYIVLNIVNNIKNTILNHQNNLHKVDNKLKLVNPLNILDRGYVLVEKEGAIVRELKKLKKGDLIDIRSKDCKREAEIK